MATALLALAILSAVGCSDTKEGTGSESQSPGAQTTSASDETTTSWIDTVPADVNYDGYTFNIGWRSCVDINEYVIGLEESSGDVVSEAIYKRNRLTEEKLNISLAEVNLSTEWTVVTRAIEKLVLANDSTYDVYSSGTWFLFQSSIKGLLVPVSKIPALDTSNVWWDSEFLTMSALGTTSYYVLNGHINYLDDYACTALFFNKPLCTDLGLQQPYDLVRGGEWTFDKFLEYVNKSSADLDGNSVYDENDQYGIIENIGILLKFLPAFGENVVIFDSEGNADLNSSERFYSAIQKVFDTMLGTNNPPVLIIERKLGYDKALTIFPKGNALFSTSLIKDMLELRQTMEDDFGVIPLPKYDESQKNYYSSYNTVWGTSFGVPITNIELERTGWILEVMGYYSTDTVYPASIDVNVMTKLARDDESAEMMQIIFDNKFYELGQWGTSIYNRICEQTNAGKVEIASFFAKHLSQTQSEFEKVKEYYDFSGK